MSEQDSDEKAFEEWLDKTGPYHIGLEPDANEAWNESCRLKNAEIEALKSKLVIAKYVLEMVVDNTKMPHQHSDFQTRLYCLSERASEALEKLSLINN